MQAQRMSRADLIAEIERLRRSHAEAERADHQRIALLAGGIAHEFNNLLVGIQGNAHLALLELDAASPARTMLEEIERCGARVADLTRRLVAFAGNGHMSLQAVELAELLREAVVSEKLGGGIELTLVCGAEPLSVRADAGQLREVLRQLLANAAEAVTGAGCISVRCGRTQATRAQLTECVVVDDLPEGAYAMLEVQDSGCGIDAAEIKRAFDPFYSTKSQGRGLGLSTVLGIVRSHRGALQIESDPRHGTTVRVLLPLAEQPSEKTPARRSLERLERQRSTVLIVDDEEAVRRVSQRMLERDGFEVLTAESGEEAVMALRERQEKIDVVLLDLTMPQMDGEMTFHQLRRIRPDLPVVFMSGHSEREVARRLIGKTRVDFLHKPFSLEGLHEKISAEV
jgi:nitrogen-specific signal transduction histidine kinase/CheY-like chemotaxis protein